MKYKVFNKVLLDSRVVDEEGLRKIFNYGTILTINAYLRNHEKFEFDLYTVSKVEE